MENPQGLGTSDRNQMQTTLSNESILMRYKERQSQWAVMGIGVCESGSGKQVTIQSGEGQLRLRSTLGDIVSHSAQEYSLPDPAWPCPALPGHGHLYSQVIYTDGRPSGVTSMQSSRFVTGYREALAVPTQPASHCGYSQTLQGPLSSAFPVSSHFCVKIVLATSLSQVSG